MADNATTVEKGKKARRPKKLRVVDAGAPKALKQQGRVITVTAIEKGWYNNRRVKRGDTFKMRVIGEPDDLLPEWCRYPDDPEARAVVEQVIEETMPKNLPAGVTQSRASFPEAVQARDLTDVRKQVAERVKKGEVLLPTEDDQFIDGEEEEQSDSFLDDESAGSSSGGGGGGRPDDDAGI